jgi:hypothetical protein
MTLIVEGLLTGPPIRQYNYMKMSWHLELVKGYYDIWEFPDTVEQLDHVAFPLIQLGRFFMTKDAQYNSGPSRASGTCPTSIISHLKLF